MDDQLDKLGAEMAKQLYSENPRLVEYLNTMILARSVWPSGYDVLGTVYETAEEAEEARSAAILVALIRAKRDRT